MVTRQPNARGYDTYLGHLYLQCSKYIIHPVFVIFAIQKLSKQKRCRKFKGHLNRKFDFSYFANLNSTIRLDPNNCIVLQNKNPNQNCHVTHEKSEVHDTAALFLFYTFCDFRLRTKKQGRFSLTFLFHSLLFENQFQKTASTYRVTKTIFF